ncbi:hypothetical protein BDV38DRAFT_256900 [Aspergillus pseudotamarii]|uniref:Uncharacterized protein n=1 Tax=Aspergillus pseudotamarii TaxID=132259 RepID=A0A5N6SGY3_ASPPS|nr:uncharacterized protein BDV38DRAFT_256900 [Aspergillus pseudotamarii]KAE8133978.1 hypothetical protein BDV38DRAFT_256900 [Aspergillus pseudotamarii]
MGREKKKGVTCKMDTSPIIDIQFIRFLFFCCSSVGLIGIYYFQYSPTSFSDFRMNGTT